MLLRLCDGCNGRHTAAAAVAFAVRQLVTHDCRRGFGIRRDRQRADRVRRLCEIVPGGRLETVLEQTRCPHGARGAARLAEHDGDDAAAVARSSGDDVIAAVADEAGLEAIGTVVGAQEAIVRAQTALANPHVVLRPERAVLGIITQYGHGEDAEVARRGQLLRRRQAVRIDEVGVRHADAPGGGVHLLGEVLDVTGHRLGKHHGDVVGRFDDQRLQGEFHRHRGADGQADLAWRLLRGEFRRDDLRLQRQLARLNSVEGHVGGHDLRQRSGMPDVVVILSIKNATGAGIEQQGWTSLGYGNGRRQDADCQRNPLRGRARLAVPISVHNSLHELDETSNH